MKLIKKIKQNAKHFQNNRIRKNNAFYSSFKMDIKQQHIRNFLRIIAGVILLVYLYDISFNKIKNGKIYLDTNDGIVILFCVAILLAIEAVKAYVKHKLGKKNE